jgi:uncharacterized protein YndB with AHSA1/START domain
MNKKRPFTLEYPVRCSPSILYEFLSTSSGLQEWFAEKVNQKQNTFQFIWDGATDEAERIEAVENELVRYRWQSGDDDEYFEFKITTSPVTNETILQITDFAAQYELKDQQLLWDSQINDLKQRIGS